MNVYLNILGGGYMITNLDEIKNLNAKEMAEFLEIISPFGSGLSFYHYINETICSASRCPLSGKQCPVTRGGICEFTFQQKCEKWLRSKSISKAKNILDKKES